MDNLTTCPYCGQYVMGAVGEDQRMYCTCDAAMDYKELLGQVDEAFVEVDRHPVFRPVGSETYQTIVALVDAVAADRLTGVSFTLPDGSKCGISKRAVMRKMMIVR